MAGAAGTGGRPRVCWRGVAVSLREGGSGRAVVLVAAVRGVYAGTTSLWGFKDGAVEWYDGTSETGKLISLHYMI